MPPKYSLLHKDFNSFILDISIAPLQVHYYSETLQATTSEGLSQGPYVVAWAETWRRIWGGPKNFFTAQFQEKCPFSG